MELSYDEYYQRVQENIETLTQDVIIGHSIRASEYHFFEKRRYENLDHFEHVNTFDILAATALGDLASCRPHGEDGYRYINGEYIEMEYKISRKRSSLIWQTPRGSLRTGRANTNSSRVSLRSDFCASFEIKNNLSSKDRLTTLLVYDLTLKTYISGYELDGPAVIKYLKNDRDGNIEKKSMKRSIMLSHFINEGSEVNLQIPSYGPYLSWEAMLKECVPVLNTGERRLDN